MRASTTMGRTTRALPVPGAIGLAVRMVPVCLNAPVVLIAPPTVLASAVVCAPEARKLPVVRSAPVVLMPPVVLAGSGAPAARMKPKLILIDGSGYIFRAFYAIQRLSNSKGMPTNAIYGFCTMLLKLIEVEKPKLLAIAFECHD